jgi:hypothetical protein
MTIQDQYGPMTIWLSSKYYGSYYRIIIIIIQKPWP